MNSARLSSQKMTDIYHAIIKIADGVGPSTYREGLKTSPRKTKKSMRPNANYLEVSDTDYWLTGPRVAAVTSRAAAFLRAYLALAGDRISVHGIESSEGEYLWLDKGVMKALLRNDWVKIDDGYFTLTSLGRDSLRADFWVSPASA